MLTVLQYVFHGMLAFGIWMLAVDVIILRPISHKMRIHQTCFMIAYQASDLRQMALELRGMQRAANRQRIAILITLHPVMLYQWLRGRFPAIPPSEEEIWISQNDPDFCQREHRQHL